MQLMRAHQRFKKQIRLIQGTWIFGATDNKLYVIEKSVPKVGTTPITVKPKLVSPLPPNTTAAEPQLPPKDKERRVPMSILRKGVVIHLKDSQNTSALLTTSKEIAMTDMVKHSSEYKEAFLEKHRVKLGLMLGYVKAAVSGLQNQPSINAVMDGDGIIYRDYIDMSIIVGTLKGLVSVIRNAEKKAGWHDVYDLPAEYFENEFGKEPLPEVEQIGVVNNYVEQLNVETADHGDDEDKIKRQTEIKLSEKLTEDMILNLEPEAMACVRINLKEGGQLVEVLIKGNDTPECDSTWEEFNTTQHTFLQLTLRTRSNFRGGVMLCIHHYTLHVKERRIGQGSWGRGPLKHHEIRDTRKRVRGNLGINTLFGIFTCYKKSVVDIMGRVEFYD